MLAGLVRARRRSSRPTRNFRRRKGSGRSSCCRPWWKTKAITAAEAESRTQAIRAIAKRLRKTPPRRQLFCRHGWPATSGGLLGSSSGDLTLRTTFETWSCSGLPKGSIARRLEAEGAKKNVSQASLVALGKGRRHSGDGWRVGIMKPVNSIASRKPGGRRDRCSSFFVYLTALQRGYTPQSVVVDRPTQIGEWEPQKLQRGAFRGMMTLRNAFRKFHQHHRRAIGATKSASPP